jgi:3-hydroxyacyl-[acyl-carrier-protein] dehydratase
LTAERPAEPKKPLLDVVQIQELLPHRPPFLLVDRVMEFEHGKRLVAWKGVTMNEPFFPGHFPGRPVMPGVLILEALAQAAGLLAMMSLGPEEKGKLTYLMGIDGARFRKPVVPGDRLELQVEVSKQKGPVWKMNGKAVVDGQECAGAEFMAMLIDPKDA